jgi:hypothetical protein
VYNACRKAFPYINHPAIPDKDRFFCARKNLLSFLAVRQSEDEGFEVLSGIFLFFFFVKIEENVSAVQQINIVLVKLIGNDGSVFLNKFFAKFTDVVVVFFLPVLAYSFSAPSRTMAVGYVHFGLLLKSSIHASGKRCISDSIILSDHFRLRGTIFLNLKIVSELSVNRSFCLRTS